MAHRRHQRLATTSAAGDLFHHRRPLLLLPPYLFSIYDLFSKFKDINYHSLINDLVHQRQQQQGVALVFCLKEVLSLFFKEDFALEGATFKSACPFSESEDENLVLQARLMGYLDTVKIHLMREILLRSDSFFEVQGRLEELNREIVGACARIREVKEGI